MSIRSTLVLAAALALPAGAAAQVCIGNAAENRRLTGVEVGTGASIADDLWLHTFGASYHLDRGRTFGLRSTLVNTGTVGTFGRQDGAHSDQYAGRISSTQVMEIPAGPDPLGLCLGVGTALSFFSLYDLTGDFVTERFIYWLFWSFPISVSAGWQINLGDDLAIVPYITPGLSYYLRLGFDNVDLPESEDELFGTGTSFFTRIGVGVTWKMITGGLSIDSGLAEYGNGTRIGIGAGIRL